MRESVLRRQCTQARLQAGSAPREHERLSVEILPLEAGTSWFDIDHEGHPSPCGGTRFARLLAGLCGAGTRVVPVSRRSCDDGRRVAPGRDSIRVAIPEPACCAVSALGQSPCSAAVGMWSQRGQTLGGCADRHQAQPGCVSAATPAQRQREARPSRQPDRPHDGPPIGVVPKADRPE